MGAGAFHRAATLTMSVAMAAIGVALLVQAFAGTSGGIVRGVVGALFVGAGAGRVYVLRRTVGGGRA